MKKSIYFAIIFSCSLITATEIKLQDCLNLNNQSSDSQKLIRKILYKNYGKLSSIKQVGENKTFYKAIIEIHLDKLKKKGYSALLNIIISSLTAITTANIAYSLWVNTSTNEGKNISTIMIAASGFSFIYSCFNFREANKITYKINRDQLLLNEISSLK